MKNFPEKAIILVLFLVQFIDVLDFMIVMPLGPDFAEDLGMLESNLGWLASSYTIAAAITGIASSTIVDRFERKKVLIFTLIGLSIANIFSANAENIDTMLLSRFIAGAFGGPATSICFAIIGDLFQDSKRGMVMGKVMSGFSLAAILGVPIGLEISTRFSWHASFYMVSLLSIITTILALIYLPRIDVHLEEARKNKVTYLSLFNKRQYVLTFIVAFCGSMAAFMIIPYVSPFIQYNLDYPREDLGKIYFLGGLGSFFAMRFTGKLVDQTSSFLATNLSNFFIVFTLALGFIYTVNFIPVMFLFFPFMVGMAIRNVSNYTLYSKVPLLSDRAGFMSIISCIQHIASSIGAIFTSLIITTGANDKLINMDMATIVALTLFIIAPFILRIVENNLPKTDSH